jgi:hypothetical protein
VADDSKRTAFLLIAVFGLLAGLSAWSVTKTIDQDLAVSDGDSTHEAVIRRDPA